MKSKFVKVFLLAILLITTATPFSARAGNFVVGSYTADQIRYGARCGIPVCRSNDGGRGFVNYCNRARQSVMPSDQQPVYIWLGDTGSCYCPCDYGFEAQVTNQN